MNTTSETGLPPLDRKATIDLSAESITDFISVINGLEQRHIAQWFYRGHCDASFRLVPSLYRIDLADSFSTYEELEQYMLRIFKNEAFPYLPSTPHDDLEWLAVAQHHRLPTRLLDWTTNPLIGLYFAVEQSLTTDADVWCLGYPSTNNCLPESTVFARRKTVHEGSLLYFPKHLLPRLTNQGGCFTVHYSEPPLDKDPKVAALVQFVRVRIGAATKQKFVQQLYDLGIHEGFVYPDLEGIARRISYEAIVKHYRSEV